MKRHYDVIFSKIVWRPPLSDNCLECAAEECETKCAANINGVKTVLLKEQSTRAIQIPFEDLKRVLLPDLPNESNTRHDKVSSALPKGQIKRPPKGMLHHVYKTYIINVGSINIDHAWYIAKMEGIVYIGYDVLYGFAFTNALAFITTIWSPIEDGDPQLI